jgi:hypothetical protein
MTLEEYTRLRQDPQFLWTLQRAAALHAFTATGTVAGAAGAMGCSLREADCLIREAEALAERGELPLFPLPSCRPDGQSDTRAMPRASGVRSD